jgi:hypothetical protein
MSNAFGNRFKLMVVCAAAALGSAAAGDDSPDAGAKPAGDDEIVVYGNVGDLRRQLLRAQDEVFARFNEINGNDDFDIHCYSEAPTGSHLQQRRCVSNGWRREEANYADASLRELRGEAGPPPQTFLGLQATMQQRLLDEARRLAGEDDAFAKALIHYGLAKQALERSAPPLGSAARAVDPLYGVLPYGARRVLDVHTGRKPWTQALEYATFTIDGVVGEIDGLTVACEQGEQHLEYQAGSEWTVPTSLGHCALRVDAKRGTTFTLYEFE